MGFLVVLRRMSRKDRGPFLCSLEPADGEEDGNEGICSLFLRVAEKWRERYLELKLLWMGRGRIGSFEQLSTR